MSKVWLCSWLITLGSATCLLQAQVTLPASGASSSAAKIVAGNTSVSLAVTLDTVSNVTTEIVLGKACSGTLTSPGGVIYDLSAVSGQFAGMSYESYSDAVSGASRLMISLSSPQGGQWIFRFTTASISTTDIPVVVNCYFSEGPQILANIPRSTVSGNPASGGLVIVDSGSAIQATVSADLIKSGDPYFPAQQLNVSFDGVQYSVDLSSLPMVGDFIVRYAVDGVGSKGPFHRNGAQLIKAIAPAATFSGSFTTHYELSYGDH